jgi:hypothetical protein
MPLRDDVRDLLTFRESPVRWPIFATLIFVTLISAIPGLSPEDWLPEPEGGLSLEPEGGEIVWSTMLPAAVQAMLAEHASPK